ncbi:MAG: biopolymer transporter ExbD, partial [Woeseiaceae bacterium]
MPASLKKRKLMGEINVVPYIDVMLVLLVIFMVTAPLLTQGIEVDLPKANAEPIESVPDHDPLVLSVDAEGNLYINAEHQWVVIGHRLDRLGIGFRQLDLDALGQQRCRHH